MKTRPFLLAIGLLVCSQITSANNAPPEGAPSCNQPTTANPTPCPPECPEDPDCPPEDPVVLSGGKFYYPATDVEIPGLGRAFGLHLRFFRGNSSQSNELGFLGQGWASTVDISLLNAGSAVPCFHDATGNLYYFTQSSSITFPDGHVSPGWTHPGFTLEPVSGGDYEMINARGIKSRFESNGRLRYQEDPVGHRITYTRDASGRVTTLTDSSGRTLAFTYGALSRVATITDPLGRVFTYGYSAAGDLTSVQGPLPLNLTESYTYDSGHNIVQVVNRRARRPTTPTITRPIASPA